MKRSSLSLFGLFPMLISLSMVVGLVRAEEGLWKTDFEAAKAQAKAENKIMLVDFTGSDWCGFCIKLRDEVFEKEAFKKEALKQFVLVELDFPHEKVLPAALKAQNEKLGKQYKITGYPTICLMDAEGQVLARLVGYVAGGPENYLERLADCRKAWEAIPSLKAQLEKAEGLDRVKLLIQLVETYDRLQNPIDELLVWCKEIVALDSENKSGRKNEFEFRVPIIESENLIDQKQVVEAVAVLRKAHTIAGLTDAQTKKLESLLRRYESFAKAMETYQKLRPDLDQAEGAARAKILDQLITAYEKLGTFKEGVEPAPDIKTWCEEIIAIDAENKDELKIKYLFHIPILEVNDLLKDKKLVEAIAVLHKAREIPGLTNAQKTQLKNMLERYEPIAVALEEYTKLQPSLETAKGIERAKLLDQLITAHGKLGMFASLAAPAPDVKAWSDEIIALDADNSTGLKNKYEFTKLLSEASSLAREKKYDEGLATIDKALALTGITPDQTQEGLMAKGTNYLAQKDYEKSLESFKKALEAAPKGSRVALLNFYIKNVQQQQKKAAEQTKKDEPKPQPVQ